MPVFLYLLREVYFRVLHLLDEEASHDYYQSLHLDNFIRPQDVTMFEPP